MRKLLIIGVAVATLTATPALALDRGTVFGGTAGAWTGGTIGFFLGGPVGAAIGAWAGGTAGAVSGHVLDDEGFYDGRRTNLSVDADVSFRIGDIVDDGVRLRHVRGDDAYGYFRADGVTYVVDLDSREIVDIRG
jgi:hypothetical protein